MSDIPIIATDIETLLLKIQGPNCAGKHYGVVTSTKKRALNVIWPCVLQMAGRHRINTKLFYLMIELDNKATVQVYCRITRSEYGGLPLSGVIIDDDIKNSKLREYIESLVVMPPPYVPPPKPIFGL